MTIVSWEFESPPLHVIDVSNDAAIAQLVEHNLAKVGVAGSSPVCRSSIFYLKEDLFLKNKKHDY